MAAPDECTFTPCDWTRFNQIAAGLFASALLVVIGSLLGAAGAWLSRSKVALGMLLLAISTALTAAAGLTLLLDGLLTSFGLACVMSVWFIPATFVLGLATWDAFRQNRHRSKSTLLA